MIDYIKGILIEKKIDKVIIEVSDTAHIINMCASSISFLPALGAKAKIYIYESSNIYGSNTTWYGFLHPEERDIFDKIKSVSKIGAKGALDILEKIQKSLPEFKKTIVDQDINTLISYFGFTRKTAEKLMLGLKNKIDQFSINENNSYIKIPPTASDAINGLVALGYKVNTVQHVVREIIKNNPDENFSVQELIKLSLKEITNN